MHPNMTGVYSGGLMYEYTVEPNEYGIVEIDSDGNAEETDEYDNLVSALSNFPAPTGSVSQEWSTTTSVACPTRDSNWEVDPSELPVMPEEAEQYMEDGAGEGPGLDGPGSHYADNTASASTASGEPSPTGSARSGGGTGNGNGNGSDDDSAAPGSLTVERSFIVVTGVTVLFTFFGTLLL